MSQTLTVQQGQQSLHAHATAKGEEVRAKYGPNLGWAELQRILLDRACVRYPTEIVFDEGGLMPGELAFPAPKGKSPEEGYTMFVHPGLVTQPLQAIYAILYQLVVINYGPFATTHDAEAFGAMALGLPKESYYQALCQIADGLL
jgi:hypothetical protein